MRDDDHDDVRNIAEVMAYTPRGILGLYYDPQERSEDDVRQRIAHVVFPDKRTKH